MSRSETLAQDAETRYRAQVQETQRLHADAASLMAAFNASDKGLDSPEWEAVTAADDAAIGAGVREMEMQAAANQALRVVGNLNHRGNGASIHGSDSPDGAPRNGKTPSGPFSLGQMFAESSEFGAWFKSVAPSGQLSEGNGVRFGQSGPVQLNNLLQVMAPKALTTGTSSTSAGAFIVADDSGIYVPLGRRPISLLDIIFRGTTGSDAVEFVRQTSRTNNAAPVAEATATSGGSGVKPESDFAYERVSTTVKTIAHWTAITRQAMSDAGQLRTAIDSELRDGLIEELEDQIISGSGVGANFEGLDTVSGTQDQAWDTDILKTTRIARRKVRTVGRDIPTAYALHPEDWERIDLLQDNEARYYYGGPAQMGTPRLWGLPVVESEALTAGWGWVGNWSRAVLWDREQANILVSDSHADFFILNLLAILAEMRAAFAVTKPVAFVEIDLTA